MAPRPPRPPGRWGGGLGGDPGAAARVPAGGQDHHVGQVHGDLARGRKLAPASGIHAAEGIVRYRTGEVVELQEEEFGN